MSSSPLKVEPAAKAQEPSMEEILASIRKIISDDDGRASPSGLRPLPLAEPKPEQKGQADIDALLVDFDASDGEPDVLELTEDMAETTEEISGVDLAFVDADDEPAGVEAMP